MRSAAEARRIFWAVALAILLSDLVSKRVVERVLAGPPVNLLGEWAQLRLVFNQGAAFGLAVGPYSRWVFLGIALVAIVALVRLSRRSEPADLWRQVACGLVVGGAAGNLVDRIRSAQGVVDFIDVGIGSHRWPTFNVADMGVSCGAILLAISLWAEDARRSRAETAPSA